MKKPIIIVAAALVLLIGGSFAFLLMQDSDEDDSVDNSATTSVTETVTEPAPTAEPTPTAQAVPGSYKDYDANLVASTPGTKVLFFHASWCPQCRQLEREIQNGTLPDNTTIFKVDYDTNQSLRQKYGVTLQTTLVKIDDQGNLVKRYVAYENPTLDSIKQNIL